VASISYGQLVPTIDTSFHPKLDNSITSVAACKISPIKAAFVKDSATYLTIKLEDDNLQNVANLKCAFVTSDLKEIKSYTFTVQGSNYVAWDGNEYLFKLFATYLKNNPDISLTLTFK
jgi:hypothetical protein